MVYYIYIHIIHVNPMTSQIFIDPLMASSPLLMVKPQLCFKLTSNRCSQQNIAELYSIHTMWSQLEQSWGHITSITMVYDTFSL